LGETTGHYETNPIKTHETSSVCVSLLHEIWTSLCL